MEKDLCQICKQRIAEHKFVRVVNGVETSYRICSHCKAVMDNKYRELQADAARRALPPEQRICPVCGTSLRDFLDSALLGCDHCYKVFEDYLIEYIRSYHGATTHVGMDNKPPRPVDVEALYKELEVLLEKKEYDKAAQIKKKIADIWGDSE